MSRYEIMMMLTDYLRPVVMIKKYVNVNYTQDPEVETCQAMLPDQVIVIIIITIIVIILIIFIILINPITGKAARQRERKR